jgi:multicomponent Na+:H+ antiporter subunit B
MSRDKRSDSLSSDALSDMAGRLASSRERRSLEWTPLLFSGGLAFLLFSLFLAIPFAETPMRVGELIQQAAGAEVGAANLVTAVVLGYRGLDTLGELAILFASATAVGLILAQRETGRGRAAPSPFLGTLFESAVQLLLPLLLLVGLYIIVHGHLTPGGGFQGGVILAVALFLPALSGSSRCRLPLQQHTIRWVEGGAGALFILIGLAALVSGLPFLTPLLGSGTLGWLLSAGTLPLLYLAVGLKVGAELAALLIHLSETTQ